MNITRSAKLMVGAGAIVGAVGALGGSAFAGSAFTGSAFTGSAFTGSAFTGTGVSTSGTAASAQFVGGTVSQAVTGATLTAISYGYTDTTDTKVSTTTLTFATTADGHAVTVAPSGGGSGVGTFTCGSTLSNASSCTYTPGADTFTGYTGLNGLAVTVA